MLLALGSLALTSLGPSTTRGATAPPLPGDTALNHWVFDVGDASAQEVRQHALGLVAHRKENHPEVNFEVFERSSLEGKSSELHVLMETVNTAAQRAFLSRGLDEICRAQVEYEEEQFELLQDVYMRLIASDPEKEKQMGPQGGVVVWSLRTRFPLAGDAVEAAARITAHLNATYSGFYVRAYDEWMPQSGTIRFYLHGSSISGWEATEAAIRRDPVYRDLMRAAADAFVEDGFEDVMLINVAR